MRDRSSAYPPARLLAGTLALGLSLAAPAYAQEQAAVSPAEFEKVKAELARQAKVIADQQAEIAELRAQRDEILSAIRAAGVQAAPQRQQFAAAQQDFPNPVTERPPARPATPQARPAAPAQPVGQAPPVQQRADADAIPPGLGVLTPRGRFVFDPTIEYVNSSSDRLVFRGVELVSGILVGAIDASDASRDTGVVTLAGRLGVTNRLEVEARVPYVWRHDAFTRINQANVALEQPSELQGQDLGDVEVGARYQLNYGRNGWPIFVANARVRAPTGTGPYEVMYDEDGVATELSTGSGFWGAEAGVTMLYPTDPAIIFGGLSYTRNFERDVNRQLREGEAPLFLGRVDPGDSIAASLGFGLSLNPRFSVSFGYGHNYVFPTVTVANGEEREGRALQVGSLMMGWSFRLTPKLTLNNAFEFGVTEDAPDLRLVLRAPYRF